MRFNSDIWIKNRLYKIDFIHINELIFPEPIIWPITMNFWCVFLERFNRLRLPCPIFIPSFKFINEKWSWQNCLWEIDWSSFVKTIVVIFRRWRFAIHSTNLKRGHSLMTSHGTFINVWNVPDSPQGGWKKLVLRTATVVS